MRTKIVAGMSLLVLCGALHLRAQETPDHAPAGAAGVQPQSGVAAPSAKQDGKKSKQMSKAKGESKTGAAGKANDSRDKGDDAGGGAPAPSNRGVILGSSSARSEAETNGGTKGDASLRPKKTRPVIGLALGGGGALGLSEVGVIQWFEEHHIPVDRVAGTSMGAMVGGLYASGKSVDELMKVMDDKVFQQVFRFSPAYRVMNYRRREDSRELPNAFTIGLKHGVSFRNSVLTDAGLNEFLDREFIEYGDKTNFDELPIPFRCVATDLNDAQVVTFSQGSVPDAIRASVSLPGVYRPVEINGHRYVDGGVLQNLPVTSLKDMQADVVLAVSLPISKVGKSDLNSLLGVLQRSFSVAIEANEEISRKQANVVIMPDVSQFSMVDYLKTPELAKVGYAAAESHKAELMKYALDDAQWQEYLAVRSSRTRGEPGTVELVKVEAPSTGTRQAVEAIFRPVVGKKVDPTQLEQLLAEVRSDGRYNADYSVDYAAGDSRRPQIRVFVTEKATGPPFLLLGANVTAETSGITRATIEGRLVDQDFGGYGSELRGVVKAGSSTEISGEYYRKMTTSGTHGYFVAPKFSFTRLPFNIYAHQARLSERLLQTTGGGADAGWTDGKNMELRAGWEIDQKRWTQAIGADGLPDYSGGSQTARVRFVYDNQDRALMPRYGVRSVTSVGYLYSAVGSESAPQMTTVFTYVHPFSRRDVFAFGLDAGTMLNRHVSEPFAFTLGGPLRLAASALDEYRGTDYFLVTPGYLHRLATLPQPLGQSIYVGAVYEAGQMYSPFAPTITRQDVYLGVVAETPIGVITIGPAIGDGGRRKFIFTLGKFF